MKIKLLLGAMGLLIIAWGVGINKPADVEPTIVTTSETADLENVEVVVVENILETELENVSETELENVLETELATISENDIIYDAETFNVSLIITCETLLNNLDKLDPAKHTLVPEDGIIYANYELEANAGESVFDILLRTTRENKIHMEFVDTPMYNSAYIEGINNLYEFDAGNMSGWTYRVNEWFPNYGCSKYEVQEGDIIEWIYTCEGSQYEMSF